MEEIVIKKKLINRKNKFELTQDLNNENFKRITCSFYKYIKINDPQSIVEELLESWSKYKILGRVYIASEGINAQLSVPEFSWNNLINFLNNHEYFSSIPIKKAIVEKGGAFIKLNIKLKNKLVADGLNDNEYNINKTGKHLAAKEFNDAMDEPKSIVVDMRNYYESEIGHFEEAICPDAATFKEVLPLVKKKLENNKNNKILMYCTGGIRCEKASAYLIHNGFKNVYQLEGGIIDYSHQIKEKNLESKFKGSNFVFDGRFNESVSDDIISSCHQCNSPSNQHTNCNNQACHILFIQCKACLKKYDGCCSLECKAVFKLPIDEQKKIRKNTHLAAPLKQYQKSIKPKLKDLISEKNNTI